MTTRLIRNNTGMALGMVLGIMAVITVLATGMFVFSTSELRFARLDATRSQAEYLARSGVEIASKAFGGVAPEFYNPDPASPMEPVKMDPFYLYPARVTENAGAGTNDTYLSSDPALGEAIGRVDVTITEGIRRIGENDYNVWIYSALAQVGTTKARAAGFSLPVSYVRASESAAIEGMDWVYPSGQIKQPANKGNKVDTQKIYNEMKGIANGMPWPFSWIAIAALESAYSGIGGDRADLYLWYHSQGGIVVVPQELGKLTMAASGGSKAYGWLASSLFFEERIDLRDSRALNAFVLGANTIVFGDDIHIYANALEMRTGNIVLQAPENGTAKVYFKGNVYMHTGSGQVQLFGAGDAFEYGENIDLARFAYDTGKLDPGFSQTLRDYLRQRSSSDKYDGTELTPLSGDQAQAPTVDSLVRVIWDDPAKGGG